MKQYTEFAEKVTPNDGGQLGSAARDNVETGVLLLAKEYLVKAIQDPELDRTHLRILAEMIGFMNRQTAKAWPNRCTIALALDLAPVTVSNRLRELRKRGYLVAERERVPEAGNRSLMVYTFGNIDHDGMRREISDYVDAIRAGSKVTPGSDLQKSQPAVISTPEVTARRARKSPPSVDSNSIDGTPPRTTTVGEEERGCGGETPSASSPKPIKLVPTAAPKSTRRSERGTRLPDDWCLSPEAVERTKEVWGLTDSQVVRMERAFRNYWTSQPGQRGVKLNWGRTWENWVDRDHARVGEEAADNARGGRTSPLRANFQPSWAHASPTYIVGD